MEDSRNRKWWTTEEVRAFLSCYISRMDEFTQFGNKMHAYSNILKELLQQNAIPPDTTAKQLDNKMKTIVRAYKLIKKRNGDKMVCPQLNRFPYKAEMDEILNGRPMIKSIGSSTKRIIIPPPAPSTIQRVIDPFGYCRICCVQFDQNTPKYSLFENDADNLTNIGEMFVEYLFKFESNNGFFDHLCSDCRTKLIDFHQFRCKAFDASKKLDELLDENDHTADLLSNIVKIEDEVHQMEESSVNFVKVEGIPDLEENILLSPCPVQTKRYKCTLCNNQFEFYKDFNNHNRKEHSQCEICFKKFRGTGSLKLHMDRVHKELMCRHCGETLFTLSALNRHESRHSADRPFACHLCDKRFATGDSIRVHVQGHSNHRRFICEICGKKFRNKSHITSHIQCHNIDKYNCEYCDKTFQRKISQKIHLEKFHLKRNLMVCSLCENVVHSLKRHAHILYHRKKGEDAIMRRVPDNYTRPKLSK